MYGVSLLAEAVFIVTDPLASAERAEIPARPSFDGLVSPGVVSGFFHDCFGAFSHAVQGFLNIKIFSQNL